MAVAARSTADIDTTVTALDGVGAEVIGVATDVTDPASCTAMATAVAEAFGGIDVLCANAGIFPEAPLATMTAEELGEVLDVNVKGNVFAVQACLPSLIASGHGRVILDVVDHGSHHRLSPVVALRRVEGRATGVHADGRDRACPHAITVNAIMPGNIITEGLADLGEDYLAGMARAIPAGALGKPADIGYLAAFLATDEAGYITGQAIAVDGGQVLPESPDAVTPKVLQYSSPHAGKVPSLASHSALGGVKR